MTAITSNHDMNRLFDFQSVFLFEEKKQKGDIYVQHLYCLLIQEINLRIHSLTDLYYTY